MENLRPLLSVNSVPVISNLVWNHLYDIIEVMKSKILPLRLQTGFCLVVRLPTAGRPERFFTKLEQIHARNFLKDTVEHVLLANPNPCVKRLLNTCLIKNL